MRRWSKRLCHFLNTFPHPSYLQMKAEVIRPERGQATNWARENSLVEGMWWVSSKWGSSILFPFWIFTWVVVSRQNISLILSAVSAILAPLIFSLWLIKRLRFMQRDEYLFILDDSLEFKLYKLAVDLLKFTRVLWVKEPSEYFLLETLYSISGKT